MNSAIEIIFENVLFEIDGAGAVEGTHFLDKLGFRMRALLQEFLAHREVALVGPWYIDAFGYQVLSHGFGIPDVQALELPHDFLFPFQPAFIELGSICSVYADTTPPHFKQDRSKLRFQFEDIPETVSLELGLNLSPDAKRVYRIRLAIGADKLCWEFPEIGFDVGKTELLSSFS